MTAATRPTILPDERAWPVARSASEASGAPTPAPERSSTHLIGLDGVRGFAILAVLVHHFVTQVVPLEPTSLVGRWLVALMRYGWSGVDLFFVLSGFLITGILLETRSTPGRARSFYARRALRIMPLYYAVVFGIAVVAPALGIMSGSATFVQSHQAWYWGYLSNALATRMGTASVPLFFLWSLAIEEQFYLIWPALVWAIRSPKGLASLCALGILGSIAFRAYLVYTHAPSVATYVLPFARADALLAGALLAVAVRSHRVTPAIRRALMAVGLLCVGCLIASYAVMPGSFVQILGFTFNLGVSVWFVSSAAANHRIWTSHVLRWFGRYSYGLYLLHPFLLSPLQRAWKLSGLPLAGPRSVAVAVLMFAVFLVVAAAVAMMSWRLLEQPFLRLKRHFEVGSAHAARRAA